VAEPTVEQLEAALARHSSGAGEVFPSALALIDLEEHWSGRLWDVLRLVAVDLDTLRYVTGGARPHQVVDAVARWAEADLDLDEIGLILRSGGYDPDPFVALARAGLLNVALCNDDGTTRLIDQERAAAWISDQLALALPEEAVERIRSIVKDFPGAEIIPSHGRSKDLS